MRSPVAEKGRRSHGKGMTLVSFRVQKDLLADLDLIAAGRPRSEAMREALIVYVEQKANQNEGRKART